MALFNGLLCASGENLACDAVKNSQEGPLETEPGRWWRSPNIKNRHTENPDEPNLNSDQALGVMLYIVEKRDKAAFRNWMSWISQNGRCTSGICLGFRVNVPRYCSLEGEQSQKCMFRPVDCPLIMLIGEALGEQTAAMSVCGPLQLLGLPNPEDFKPKFGDLIDRYRRAYKLVKGLQDKIIQIHQDLGLAPPPPLPLPPDPEIFESKFGAALKRLGNEVDNVEAIVKVVPSVGGQVVAYAGALILVEANAHLNGKEYKEGKLVSATTGAAASARHLAGSSIFLLDKFWVSAHLRASADDLLRSQPANPFLSFSPMAGRLRCWI